MDKRKHGPLAPTEYVHGIWSSTNTCSISKLHLITIESHINDYYCLKLHVVGQSLSHPNQLAGSSNSVSLRSTVHTPYGVAIYIAFSGGQRRRRMIYVAAALTRLSGSGHC